MRDVGPIMEHLLTALRAGRRANVGMTFLLPGPGRIRAADFLMDTRNEAFPKQWSVRYLHPDEPLHDTPEGLVSYECPTCRAIYVPGTTFAKSVEDTRRAMLAEPRPSRLCGSCLRRRDEERART